ncbi:MAG: BamA/TamA family outer membrane protein [Vicinamibacteria bacterium]
MHIAVLLIAVLGPFVGLAAAEGADIVSKVRIEAPDPEGLERFVEVEAGRPLDPVAVRHTVELIYATGQFEDVRVELEREEDGGGVSVVIRALPAPLLVDVRVEGDRVLSAGTLRRITRLRRGEPLWESRCELAGRDAGLALKERGYLEALVEVTAETVRGGADALFHVHAGPLVRVGSASVSGAAGFALDDLIRPRLGGVYRLDRATRAAESMRQRLARADHWRATVDARETYVPGPALMGLVFQVTAGAPMDLEVRGAKIPRGLLGEVRGLLREGGIARDVLEAAAERIETHLRHVGHREATVRALIELRGEKVGRESVVFDTVPGPRALVASIELEGADAALLSGLGTGPGEPIEDSVLGEDARTLTRRLEERGHFEASVEVDVPEGGGALPVVFLARPGPKAMVVEVEIDGPPLPPSRENEDLQELAVRPGLPYRVRDVAASREVLLSAWRRAGFLAVTVGPENGFSDDRTEVRVRLVVEPGPRTIVECIVVAGLRQTKEVTVAREIDLRPGEPFSFERVLESQRRLLSLGIFERVTISELDTSSEEQRDVVVSVQEAPRTTVSWGVGYSEQDLLRGSVELTRRNLNGLGRTASVFARGSFRGNRFLLNVREPWLFGKDLDSFLTAFFEEEDRSSFDFNRKGGVVQAGQKIDTRTTLIYRYLFQDTNVFNIEVPEEEIDRQFRTYTVSGPAFSVVWDARDDPLEPRRGAFFASDLGLSLDALGGVSYVKGFVQTANIRRLRSDLALVLSVRLGLAATYGADSPALLPLPERFFAGGAFGPRGWIVDGVGPQVITPEGEVFATGGNALLLGGAELRYDLTRSFQLATFLDVGNVYPEVRDLSIADLRRSVGLGLRYLTPIGPIRLDYGHKIHRLPGESPGRFHLTIGYAF